MKKILPLVTALVALIVIPINPISACTGFTATQDDTVLVGHNEDWYDPDPYIRVYPSEGRKYGRIYFEFSWPLPWNLDYFAVFGGVNDQGLVFDSYLHPLLKPVESWFKPRYDEDLMCYCMEVCSTVEEVLVIFDRYNLDFMDEIQYQVVDRTGNSVIIEGDEIIYKDGDYQVVTNFLQSNPEHGWYPCWRYETAVDMLENMTELSVDYFTSICNATHQEETYPTVYSTVYDLNKGIIYLYHMYDYENVVKLNITEELELGEHSYHLPSLFVNSNVPPDTPTKPSGSTSGKAGTEYTYTTGTIDPDGDQIYYLFDWGDSETTGWLGSFENGEIINTSHVWNKTGTYEIRVRAKDEHGLTSEWSDPLAITMPKNKAFNPLFQHFFERYLHMFPIIRYILKL